jgi:hypothetical protein
MFDDLLWKLVARKGGMMGGAKRRLTLWCWLVPILWAHAATAIAGGNQFLDMTLEELVDYRLMSMSPQEPRGDDMAAAADVISVAENPRSGVALGGVNAKNGVINIVTRLAAAGQGGQVSDALGSEVEMRVGSCKDPMTPIGHAPSRVVLGGIHHDRSVDFQQRRMSDEHAVVWGVNLRDTHEQWRMTVLPDRLAMTFIEVC